MALARLRDSAVIIHGPRSCAYLMDSAYLSTVADLYTGGVYDDPMPDNIYCTCMDDSAAIFGGADSLRGTMESAYADGFREVVVVTTCVSGMIGDDCDAVARGFRSSHPDVGTTVLSTDGVINGDYLDGTDVAVSELIRSIDPSVGPVPGEVNLIGASFFDLQCPDAAAELRRMLGVFGLRVNCRLLDDTTMGSVRGFCRGTVDILLNEDRASDFEDRVVARRGRSRERVRLPTGPYEYAGWLRRMSEVTGIPCEAEEDWARSMTSRFMEDHRDVFEGRRIVLSTVIPRNMDWLVDALTDMGAVIVRFGYAKGPGERCGVTARYRDMLTFDYGKKGMSEDWDALHPDLLLYDLDIPDGYPGRSMRLSRIGPGIVPPLRLLGSISDVLSTGSRGCPD